MSHNFKSQRSHKRKHLPINLARKEQREQRIRNDGIGKNRAKNIRKRLLKKKKPNFERKELDTLINATENQLKDILENEQLLSDIPYDVTPEELQGEVALAQGGGTTIYIERDGLSTLTIILPQEFPTIAQLRRAIEAQARVQQARELRERYEERLRRRGLTSVSQTIEIDESAERKHKQVNKLKIKAACVKPLHATGELVCSKAHNGHHHRPNVSWRFLWRAYILFNTETKSFIDDKNGRKLLKECGIENAQTLKFYKREKYFGRKRQ